MINYNKKTRTTAIVALHALVWGLWFAAPVIFSVNRFHPNSEPKEIMTNFIIWIPMTFSLILFYLNYAVLINKLLFSKKITWFIIINILVIVLFSYLSDILRNFFLSEDFTKHPRPPIGFVFGLHNFSFLFIVSISVAIKTTGRWFVTENQRKILENENLKSELNNLKMQLNPHFFFNTLNNIYSLIQTAPDKAQESVHGLAKLMRYMLYETDEERVSLNGEVEIMKNYIALMQLRLSNNVKVDTLFELENPSATIAPILFIPLVENSFKHGTSSTEDSEIKIFMQEKNRILTFETYNTNFPQKYENDDQNGNKGIGLENLQKRLSLIYPGKYSFTRGYENKMFHVKVVLQL